MKSYPVTGHLATDQDHLVVINKDLRRLTIYGKIEDFPVAVGKNPGDKQQAGDMRTPETPPGTVFRISQKLDTPPDSEFGPRFMRLQTGWHGIAIHGTNDPVSIGTAASHGCIRMYNRDVLLVAGLLQLGDPVIITS